MPRELIYNPKKQQVPTIIDTQLYCLVASILRIIGNAN